MPTLELDPGPCANRRNEEVAVRQARTGRDLRTASKHGRNLDDDTTHILLVGIVLDDFSAILPIELADMTLEIFLHELPRDRKFGAERAFVLLGRSATRSGYARVDVIHLVDVPVALGPRRQTLDPHLPFRPQGDRADGFALAVESEDAGRILPRLLRYPVGIRRQTGNDGPRTRILRLTRGVRHDVRRASELRAGA